jgi:stage III sporulation protein AD
MPDLKLVLEIINNINQKFNIRQDFIKILIKIIGIAYICEFISQVCIDSEQKNLADKINLAGKILIMSVSLPIVIEVLNLIYEF